MAKNGFKPEGREGVENRLSVRVPVALSRRIDRIAKANGISSADVVRMALNSGLPVMDSKPKAA